jgi:lipopolysaccharide transport system ATP-binding protein
MSKAVIKASGLSKEYLIGARERQRETFREMLMSAATAPFTRFGRLSGRAPAENRIWALRDVSFEVHEGEIVGLVGRNGAGKSTLLKLLSRITTPTKGRAEIRGRVGSLLEVGTGFHPELTGRENIFLNGAILGMSREEIRKKFDEIVDFAGIEAFLDTPVKRYSSGMAVRLAFAVAAHLETEVLLVDEVLAVGDAEFQRKCLGKMSDVAHSGRTIIFVSHNMAAVENLCSRGLLLDSGKVVLDAAVDIVLSRYLRAEYSVNEQNIALIKANGCDALSLIRVHARNSEGQIASAFATGRDIQLCAEFNTNTKAPIPIDVAYLITNSTGILVYKCYSALQTRERLRLNDSEEVRCLIRAPRLVPGDYAVGIMVASKGQVLCQLDQVLTLHVQPADVYGTGKLPKPPTGVYLPDVEWFCATGSR